MPRPGPRPYECVRRAWHSDRHQPMRGSVIQHIFRVVKDTHSSTTRKNREWQEKLPTVVLKAEEIMYSKANSEAEYIDHDTLWDRLNDAIDTIIRKDETTESGEYLQPCIEAALILGCTQVRASRSQRHCNPRTYLTPRTQEQQTSVAPVVSDVPSNVRPPTQPHNPCGNQLSISRPKMGNYTYSAPNFVNVGSQNNYHIPPPKHPFFCPNYSPTAVPSEPIDSRTTSQLGSVYPLYYGTQLRNGKSQFSNPLPQNSTSNHVILGRPVWSLAEPSHFGATKNLFPSERAEHASEMFRQENRGSTTGKTSKEDCDLSLRLGPVLDPFMSNETQNHASKSCQEDTKVSPPNREFSFFPRQGGDGIAESQRGIRVSNDDDQYVNATMRKRKAPFCRDAEDGSTFWQPEVRPDQLTGLFRQQGL